MTNLSCISLGVFVNTSTEGKQSRKLKLEKAKSKVVDVNLQLWPKEFIKAVDVRSTSTALEFMEYADV